MLLIAADKFSPADKQDFLALLGEYIADPMGGGPPLSEGQKNQLWQDLQQMEQARIFFALEGGLRRGYLLAFEAYTSFLVGKNYNIHDFFISREFRGRGFGGQMMDQFIRWAREKGAKKITLEVRDDNNPARELYLSRDFGPADPPMLFYSLKLF